MRHRIINKRTLAYWLGLILLGVMLNSGLSVSGDSVRQECMRNGAIVESPYPKLAWDKGSNMPGWHIVCKYYYFDENSEPVTWSVGYVYSLRGTGLGITQMPQRDGNT